MAINSALKGAIVPASDLSGQDLNSLVNQGIISPREGGQAFEFLKPFSASNPSGTTFDGFVPQDPSRLQSGDTIIPSDNLTQNSAQMQSLIQSGSVIRNPDGSFRVVNAPVQGQNPLGQGDFLQQNVQQLLDAQRSGNEQSRINSINQAQQSAAQQVQRREDVGGRQAGGLNRILGRAGGFTTTAGGQAQSTLTQNIENDITEINAAKDQVVANINAAAAANDITAMQNSINTLLQLDQRQREIQNTFFNQQLQSADLQLQQQAGQRAQQQLEFNMEQSIAGLTGTFRGEPTYQAQQDGLKNLLDIAGLTGEFMGAPTLEAQQNIIQNAFEQAKLTGVFDGQPTLAGLSLQETIRSNKAREALSAQANAISASRVRQASLPLNQGTLNELAANGIDNETALAINKFLGTQTTAQVGQNADGSGIFSDPIQDAKNAIASLGYEPSIIDTYIDVITQPSQLEQFNLAFGGSSNTIDDPNE